MPLEQQACPICLSRDRNCSPALYRWGDVDWLFQRCRDCGHRYTDPLPTGTEIEQMYDDAYFEGEGEWVCGYWEGSYIENEENLRSEAREMLPILGRTSGSLLEVGCAGGFFLDEARKRGFEVQGVEINEQMAAWARNKLKLDVVATPFEDFAPGKLYDTVVAQDVLEHVRSPRGFVSRARQLLAPDGVLIIRGPLEEDFRTRIFEGLREVFRKEPRIIGTPPFHLQGFTSSSFRKLLETYRFDLKHFQVDVDPPAFDARGFKGVAGSMIGLFAHMLNRLRNKGHFMVARAARCAGPVTTDHIGGTRSSSSHAG